MSLLRTGAAVAGSSLVLAACGGDDALSRDDYVKQANAVCRDYNQKVAGLPEPQSFEDVPAFVDKGKALAGEAVGKLDELEPPEELKADHEAFVKEGREVSATADRIADAAKKKDEAALQRAAEEGERRDEASDKRAQRMGLTECAKDS